MTMAARDACDAHSSLARTPCVLAGPLLAGISWPLMSEIGRLSMAAAFTQIGFYNHADPSAKIAIE